MKKKVFITMICSFLVFPLWGQTFSEVDFERLLMNHPMMKNYDPKTGHFRNTPYALHDVKSLKNENASLKNELKALIKNEKNNSKAIITEDIKDEEAFWSKVSDFSDKKLKIENKIDVNDELITSKGDPGYVKLFPIVDKMCNDLLIPMYDKNKVVLNKLPRYYIEKPNFGDCDFKLFWFSKNPEALKKYLQFAPVIAMIFSKSDKAILYQKSGESK